MGILSLRESLDQAKLFLKRLNNFPNWPSLYTDIRDGDFLYIFGPITGLCILPDTNGDLYYRWLEYKVTTEYEDGGWFILGDITTHPITGIEEQKRILEKATEYLELFATKNKNGYYKLPWTNSRKQTFNP